MRPLQPKSCLSCATSGLRPAFGGVLRICVVLSVSMTVRQAHAELVPAEVNVFGYAGAAIYAWSALGHFTYFDEKTLTLDDHGLLYASDNRHLNLSATRPMGSVNSNAAGFMAHSGAHSAGVFGAFLSGNANIQGFLVAAEFDSRVQGSTSYQNTDGREYAYMIGTVGGAQASLNGLPVSNGIRVGVSSGNPDLAISGSLAGTAVFSEARSIPNYAETRAVAGFWWFQQADINAAVGASAHSAETPSVDLTTIFGGSSDSPLPYIQTSANEFHLVAPVVGGYGTMNPAFAAHSVNEAEQTGSSMATAIGYVFRSENDGPTFGGFSIPAALKGGQMDFQLGFAGVLVNISAGDEIDFTQFVERGVREFSLLGIDLAEGLDASLPPTFTHSFRFTSDGAASVSAIGIPVPEPSSWLLSGIGLAICVTGRMRGYSRRFRPHQLSTPLQGRLCDSVHDPLSLLHEH